jgi:hypothetical protein
VNGMYDETYDQEYEGDYEMLADQEGDFEADFEADFESDYESDYEGGFDSQEGPFSEGQELELAAELLGVSEEAELDQFLGDLFKRVKGAAGQLLKSPAGQALKGVLKSAAKKALPTLGRAVGSYFGGAKGGDLGAQAADYGARMFGLELEGMSPEDGELEVAKRFVRLAGDAASEVAQTAGSGPPQQVAMNALATAARTHAPGMMRGAAGTAPNGGRHADRRKSGRWFRRGRHIVLVGL